MNKIAENQFTITKSLFMEGMLRIFGDKEAELKTRFSTGFLRKISLYKNEVFACKEIAQARELGACMIRQVADGGIFCTTR